MLVSEICSFIFLLLIVGLTYLANFFLHRMNTYPLLIQDEEFYSNSFISQRAFQNLQTLNDYGPKVVGSNANEVLAANFILDYVNEVKRNATNPSDVIIDHQIVSGTTFGTMPYFNVQNIVVKLQGETNHSLLINSHFDSVPGSPGASDANVMICIMLEILRVLSRESKRQKHSIVFLFNGAEEVGLQAAHGFITQHPLKDDIRALINLDSIGSGGRELLFRSGPKHDWLVKMYKEATPRPFAHVIAEDIFKTGLILSNTDFIMFRDYGSIPGLDIVCIENGWRYHTRYDNINYISLESVQHTGNNIISLTRKIANSNELANPPEGDNAVYFEYLGFFMISYTQSTGVIINLTVSILAFIIPFLYHARATPGKFNFVFSHTILSFVTFVLSIAVSALACYGLATLMQLSNNLMSWFNVPWISIGLYWSLAVMIQLLVYQSVRAYIVYFFSTENYRKTSLKKLVQININGVNLFWALITVTGTILGYRTVYVTMCLLLTALLTFIIQTILKSLLPKQSWVIIHTIGHSFTFISMSYMGILFLLFFIPTTSRYYSGNPDVLIGMICVLWSVLSLSYFIPLSQLTKYRAVLYSTLLTFFIASLITAFSSVGFPYSNNLSNPRLQSFRSLHIRRSLYDMNGTQLFSTNSYTFYPWDKNGLRTLQSIFGKDNLKKWDDDALCRHFICGYPHFAGGDSSVILGGSSDSPNIQPTEFKLNNISRSETSIISYTVEFSLELKSSVHISITPEDGYAFSGTNLDVFHKIDSYFITQITTGLKEKELLNVTISLDVSNLKTGKIATIGIINIDSTFEQGDQTAGFKNVLNALPDYTSFYVQQADSSFYEIGVL